MKKLGALIALVSAGTLSFPAISQQVTTGSAASPDPNVSPNKAVTTESGPSPSTATSPGDFEEIVVTALKGSTKLQKTPAAVTVVPGFELVDRQLTDINGLGDFVPSFKTNVEESATQFFARGVGKQVDNGHIPEAVGLVIDGLSIPQRASGVALFDVDSIQMLPGPQGTLYGSAAIGGVVNITTARPTMDFEGSTLLDVGTYGTVHPTIIQNIPVTDDWHLRAAYDGNYHGAYNNNGTYTDNMTAFRLSSLYQPDDTLSVFITGTYATDSYREAPTVPFPLQTKNPYKIPSNDPATAEFYPPNGLPLNIGHIDLDIAPITVEVEKKIDDLTVTYTGGYLYKRDPQPEISPVAGFLQTYTSNVDLFNNEIKISNGNSSDLSWTAGLYQYFSTNRENIDFGPNLLGWNYSTQQKTYAGYGQVTYSVLSGTRLTAGLRESIDSLSTGPHALDFFPIFTTNPIGRGVIPFSYDKSWLRLNWKVGAEQDLSPTSLLYATIQSGFNPGTFNGNPPTPASDVQPQTMIGYTIGSKNQFFDSQLTLNLEGFLYDYTNQIISTPNLTNGENILQNAQSSRIDGFQVDSTLKVSADTKIRASVGYLNATFTNFTYSSAGVPFDFGGNTLPFAPRFTANLGITQIFGMGDKGSVVMRIDSYLTSSYWFTYDNQPGLKQGGYSKTDASIMYHSPEDDWEFGIWAKNLENNAIAGSAGVASGRSYPGVVYLDPPRTVGARFLIKY
jgi:iron complex outermembrane recepter protein